MLTLWSRAARTPGSCRCIQCVSNTHANANVTALARRAGGGSLRRTWAFGTPTSSFCYTAIFAAGLAIDAKAKRDRNEQWDTAFTLLREEMAKVLDANAAQEATSKGMPPAEDILTEGESLWRADFASDKLPGDNSLDWNAVFRAAGNSLTEDAVFDMRQAQVEGEAVEDVWELLAIDSRFPGTQALHWPANTGRNLIRHHLPPQSLWSLDHMREKSLRRRHTWKKLAVQELSVALLVQRILSQPCVRKLADDILERNVSYHVVQSISEDVRGLLQLSGTDMPRHSSDIRQGIQALQNAPLDASDEAVYYIKSRLDQSVLPSYSQDRDGDFYTIGRQLNAAIRAIFTEAKGGRKGRRPDDSREEALALTKIAHNLLISPAPPDVQTFNILITNFKRWSLFNLVDATIHALDECKIRPNELTCAAILDYHTRRDQPEAFSNWVAKMRGVKKALMLARPDININEAGGGRLVRVSEKKVFQKVHPTPLVFNPLMLGVLKFAGLERALEIYYEMKDDGWGLDVLSLTNFLSVCVENSDWQNGLYIWQEISSIKTRAEKTHMAKAYVNMLSLCTVTGNTNAYNQILQEVVRLGLDGNRILKLSMTLTQKTRKAKAPSIPPWAADNVLIAVSGLMDDANSSRSSSGIEADDLAETGTLAEADTFTAEDLAHNVDTPTTKDTEAAWSTWMAHELGEKEQQLHQQPVNNLELPGISEQQGQPREAPYLAIPVPPDQMIEQADDFLNVANVRTSTQADQILNSSPSTFATSETPPPPVRIRKHASKRYHHR